MAINVPSVSPSQAKEIISLLEPLGVSVMLWGPPGVGKSDIVDQIARDRDGELIDLRLSHKIASDVGGLPMVDRETKTTVFAKPSWFPAEDAGSPTVLFLDELAGADEHTRIAAYGLLLERRVDAWKLPNNCQVVAASNRTEDGAISAEFGGYGIISISPNTADAKPSFLRVHAHFIKLTSINFLRSQNDMKAILISRCMSISESSFIHTTSIWNIRRLCRMTFPSR
jgi:ATP-dependent 26S proteasome regulatory subunit